MDTEKFSKTKVGKVAVKFLAKAMESRFRHRYFDAGRILQGADNLEGQNVLEIGCGTGFFTIQIARLIGENGSLTSIDILQESVDHVSKITQDAVLKNVRVLKRNVLNTYFDNNSFNTVVLFGVIPAPMLPLKEVLAEIHRLLTSEGILLIWPSFSWLPRSIIKSGLFTFCGKKGKVFNFKKNDTPC
jgi:ubiquinone/menaquinone biosynthesis C-methylase UbiE